jgi:ABC-type uncharacterized transport system substrate-binding protein
MKRQTGRIFALCFSVVVLLFSTSIWTVKAESEPHHVFILHSYEENHVCGQPQHDGVVAALEKAGFTENKNLEIQTYFMDTKRKNNTPELMEEQAQLALKKINDFRPQVLVTLDDNAFRTVALKLVDKPLSIVFCGMNGQPEDYNKKVPSMDSRSRPGHNITGVYEKLHLVDAVRVHSKLRPDLKKIKMFVDTSPTGRAIYKQMKLEIERESLPCSWEIHVAKSWEEYQREIRSANKDSDVGVIYPAALLLKDREGNSYTAPKIFAWTTQNSNKPEIALNYAFTRMGLFGGAAVDFYAMGSQAGKMVAKILHGENPGNISIEEAYRYALAFNLDRAEKLGLEIPLEILMAADEVVSSKR